MSASSVTIAVVIKEKRKFDQRLLAVLSVSSNLQHGESSGSSIVLYIHYNVTKVIF